MKPTIFRIYPDDARRYWCEVRVFRTREAMLRRAPRTFFSGMRRGDVAAVQGAVSWTPSGRRSGQFAVMVLNRVDVATLGLDVLSHEATHAGLRYLEKRGYRAVSTDCLAPPARGRDVEELLAYSIGAMVIQLQERLAEVL